jgi:XTP/dITP diphosphohydrolase
VIATANKDKLAELISVFEPMLPSEVEIAPYSGIAEIAEPEENGATFAENAEIKAIWYAREIGLPCLSDDSGLCVDALEGAPGVYSRRYAPTNEARITKLLDELQKAGADNPDKRRAKFVCSTALAFPDGRLLSAEGECFGQISLKPSGSAGFGYDPVFYLPSHGKTMADLTPEEKNKISHRSKALKTMANLLFGFLVEAG